MRASREGRWAAWHRHVFVAMSVIAGAGADRQAHGMTTKTWEWHAALVVAATDRGVQAALPEADWVGPMKKVHAHFTGKPGTFAHFGDSITVSRAFWTGLQWDRKNAPPEMARAYELVKKYMRAECWDWKGPQFGSEGGMTIRWAHENVDQWLGRLNPEVALIMFGTNDLGGLELAEYETKTRQVVRKCLDHGTIVILSTIPPKHGQARKGAEFAEAVRRIAREMKVPLSDYQAEILRRRPDDWDGAMAKFKAVPGDEYNVPTLLARDGIHPSNPRKYAGDFSEERSAPAGTGCGAT